MIRRARLLLLTLLLLCAGAARADVCTVTMSDINFGQVSPIGATDYTATGTGSVSCTWSLLSPTFPFILLFPNVVVCLNAGLGSNSLTATPRTLGNGSNRMEYNLYRDASYAAASIWGGPGVVGATTPISFSMTSPNILIGGTLVQAFTVYAKIPVGTTLAAVPTVANSDTVYNSSFTGAATITYAFYNLIKPACTPGSSNTFAFQVNATAVNNCTITATPLAFGTNSVLTGNVRSTATLSVRCVNNNAYQIALNGGLVTASVANRQMKNVSTADTVAYQLSAMLDGPLWGDGTAGTSMVSGTGTGVALPITVYGRVPAQGTPIPGDYKDTVTATVYF
ncbi:Csu type fimbrial protein [Janthinobacterium agaricidamnosum]|uniref:Spore Coat Protein U domain protein n=1 Tax=Janthinobacterium agaricidamnosum NBRC 102515 = DSM 9628 TaxID=1349767 RepID=W0VC00_9BURK|nr:spore coat U domain-containing protein [Janthinobacterium agaricidamnosum]CDG85416.1 spore Coat Protein U domain protein [Janthinobacterium agaricidamnosum NBRC 102515 = DSM 9628]